MSLSMWTIEQLKQLPEDCFYVTVNGRIVDLTELGDNVRYSVHFRLRGGKGGELLCFRRMCL